MNRRVLKLVGGVALGAGALVLVIWLLTMGLQEREVKYEGKSISEWAATAPGAPAWATITNQILPAIRDRMFNDTNDSLLRMKLADQLNSLPGVAIQVYPASTRRAEAARGLGEFGSNAGSILPDLIRLVKGNDTEVRPSAIEALGKIRTAPSTVIPLLVQCLDEPDEEVKVHAAEALAEYGPLAKEAAPKLVPLLKYPSKELPPAARKALAAIDPGSLPAK